MAQWPTLEDYRRAVQNPRTSFRDSELKKSKVRCHQNGLPLVWAGQFAVVFSLQTAAGKKAVRCFTSSVSDQAERYQALHEHLRKKPLECFTPFEYLEQGIIVSGRLYPAVKMGWVDGTALDEYVDNAISAPRKRADTKTLEFLAYRWHALAQALRQTRIAHGDLQHENVLVDDRANMRLVDYDCAFVPGLAGRTSLELGHPNYQHPRRTSSDFHEGIDNFSILVIYLSLRALATDPSLWRRFHTDKHLLFKSKDFKAPGVSPLFRELATSSTTEVRELTTRLQTACSTGLASLPPIQDLVKVAAEPWHGTWRPPRIDSSTAQKDARWVHSWRGPEPPSPVSDSKKRARSRFRVTVAVSIAIALAFVGLNRLGGLAPIVERLTPQPSSLAFHTETPLPTIGGTTSLSRETALPTIEALDSSVQLYVTASALNIRLKPGANESVVGGAYLGDMLLGTGELASAADGGRWYRVLIPSGQYEGRFGWVNARHVSTVPPTIPAGE